MLPYSRGLILDNTHNYGIMKTETVFGFGPQESNYGPENVTDPLQWIFANGSIEKRSLKDEHPSKPVPKKILKNPKANRKATSKKKKTKRKSKKINKCIIKFMKGGEGDQGYEEKGKKRRRKGGGGGGFKEMKKKYMMPLILGLLAAKSVLIPIALKALAFMSAKGLMMGFFSTVLASVISLKGMFNQPHESSKRNDDTKTQVEIIQVPTKSEDHVYYDEHYRRGDLVPIIPTNDFIIYDNNNIMKRKAMNMPNNDFLKYENKNKKKSSKL